MTILPNYCEFLMSCFRGEDFKSFPKSRKATPSGSQVFDESTRFRNDGKQTIYNYTLNFFVYLNRCMIRV